MLVVAHVNHTIANLAYGLVKYCSTSGFSLLISTNISSIVGQLYKDDDIRKDGAYTIFYMGINAGAFLGILLCGYLGEKVGWHWGFGLAGIFMFFGMLQFYFAQNIHLLFEYLQIL